MSSEPLEVSRELVPDGLRGVVEAYAKWAFEAKFPEHFKKFQTTLTGNLEAASAEAVIFDLLRQSRLHPQPSDTPGTGGADFICSPDGREQFVVEVTAFGEDAVERQTGIPREGISGVYRIGMMTHALRTRISSKADQLSGYQFARVLAITTTHQLSFEPFGRMGAEALLSSDVKLQIPLNDKVRVVTDLRDSIFFKYDDDGNVVCCRESISAILLVKINTYDGISCVLGILHPEPLHRFSIDNLPEVPFLRVSEWPIKKNELEWHWGIVNPRPRAFTHSWLAKPGQAEATQGGIPR